MCYRSHGVGRIWLIVYLTVSPDYQVVVFLQSKLFITTIPLGKSLSNIPCLPGKAFINKNEKSALLAMSDLWRHLIGIVVTMYWVLSLDVHTFLSFSATYYLAVKVFIMAFISDNL